MYEVVVFSSLPQHEADAIVKKLDPFGCISYGLYRFATSHRDGKYMKDIYRLNRDPEKILVMGHDAEGFGDHLENLLRTASWEGDGQDRQLEEAVDFLEMLAFSKLKDLRPVVAKHAGKTFPESFEAGQEAAFEKTRQEAITSLRSRASNPFFRLFGFGSAKEGADLDAQFPTYRAKKAERMAARRKEWDTIRGLMQKQLEAEMEKEKAFYQEHKMPLWDLFSKGPPQPPPAGAAGTYEETPK